MLLASYVIAFNKRSQNFLFAIKLEVPSPLWRQKEMLNLEIATVEKWAVEVCVVYEGYFTVVIKFILYKLLVSNVIRSDSVPVDVTKSWQVG